MKKIVAVITLVAGLSFCALLIVYMVSLARNQANEPKASAVIEPRENDPLSTKPETDVSDKNSQTNVSDQNDQTNVLDQNGQANVLDQLDQNEIKTTAPADNPQNDERVIFAQVALDVPVDFQNPELPRGCEVTALAMLMRFHGIDTDKMTLAEKIAKCSVKRENINGNIHWGDPNDGFIGDMYDFSKQGLGVYHKPIFDLLTSYTPNAKDITGGEFTDIEYYLSEGLPVWVIINSLYDFLGQAEFQTWHTPNGIIQITYRMHASVVTGFDEKYIYFSDPLYGAIVKDRESAVAAWEQMGRQAVIITT